MRRFYNNGTSFVEALTKGAANLTPGGAIANVVKKVIKSKEDKKSRNTNPKTPKMMGTDKDLKKEEKEFSSKRMENTDRSQLYKKKKLRKFEKPVFKFKPEVKPARKLED